MGTLDFGSAIIIAFSCFLVAGTINQLLVETPGRRGPLILQEAQRNALVSLIGGFGIIAVLIGMFISSLDFGYSIVICYGFFLISGVFKSFVEIQEYSETEVSSTYSPLQPKHHQNTQNLNLKSNYVCHSCGSTIDKEDLFCPSCGAEQ